MELDLSLIVVVPKEPYIDWAIKTAESEGTKFYREDFTGPHEHSCWLVPSFDSFSNPDELEDFLKELKPVLFREELLAWSDDEATWPKELNAIKFDEWFDLQRHSGVRSIGELFEDSAEDEDDDEDDISDGEDEDKA